MCTYSPDWVYEVVRGRSGKKAREERDTVHKKKILPHYDVPLH